MIFKDPSPVIRIMTGLLNPYESKAISYLEIP
jgi:hypothetical protein